MPHRAFGEGPHRRANACPRNGRRRPGGDRCGGRPLGLAARGPHRRRCAMTMQTNFAGSRRLSVDQFGGIGSTSQDSERAAPLPRASRARPRPDTAAGTPREPAASRRIPGHRRARSGGNRGSSESFAACSQRRCAAAATGGPVQDGARDIQRPPQTPRIRRSWAHAHPTSSLWQRALRRSHAGSPCAGCAGIGVTRRGRLDVRRTNPQVALHRRHPARARWRRPRTTPGAGRPLRCERFGGRVRPIPLAFMSAMSAEFLGVALALHSFDGVDRGDRHRRGCARIADAGSRACPCRRRLDDGHQATYGRCGMCRRRVSRIR